MKMPGQMPNMGPNMMPMRMMGGPGPGPGMNMISGASNNSMPQGWQGSGTPGMGGQMPPSSQGGPSNPKSATEGSALNAVEKVCRNSIPSKLPSATKPKSRHVDGNYDLCSAQWTEKLSAPKGCPTTQTVAALKAELHTLGLSTSGTKVQFTSWLYCSHNFSGGTSFKAS